MNGSAEDEVPAISGLLRVSTGGNNNANEVNSERIGAPETDSFVPGFQIPFESGTDLHSLRWPEGEQSDRESLDEDGFVKLPNDYAARFDVGNSNTKRIAIHSLPEDVLKKSKHIPAEKCLEDLDHEMDKSALVQWKSLFDSSCTFRSSSELPKFPWERGFAARVFAKPGAKTAWEINASKAVAPPKIPLELSKPTDFKPHYLDTLESQAAETVAAAVHSGSWATIAHRLASVSLQPASTCLREAAYSKWKYILQLYPDKSELGRKLLKDIMMLKSDEHLSQVIADIFSIKSTLTLHKRANSLIKFFAYCHNTMRVPVPVIPVVVYVFMKTPQMSKPSAAQSLREALNFAGALLGLDRAKKAASDPLVAGAAGTALINKRIRKQARLFTKKDVRKLLEGMRTLVSMIDKSFLGQCLFLMILRARWSDGQHVEQIIEDFLDGDLTLGGYLQANTTRHKTATSANKKRIFLEMTGPVKILGDSEWYELWQEAREQCGLGKISDPMLPVVGRDGQFGKEPLPAGEASIWLQDLCRNLGCEYDDHTTHCLKALYLSWSAKFHIPYEDRAVLGYHVIKGRESTYCYARDNMSGPLRALDDMLKCLEEGTFDPDSTRSGRFRKADSEEISSNREFIRPRSKCAANPSSSSKALPVKQEVVEPMIELSSESESDSSTDSDESVEPEEESHEAVIDWENMVGQGGRRPAKGSLDENLVFHVKRLTLHKRHLQSYVRTACGREITSSFEELEQEPQFEYPKCLTCFGPS